MKLIFTGDLSASGFVFEKMENDDSRLLDNLAVHFSKADYVHVNLENPITSCPFRDDKKGARLRASTKLASYLKRVGIKICCIANNHIMDCGELGLVETDKLLSKQGVISYGTNLTKTYIILQNGKTKVVLVALSQCEGPVASVKKRGPYAFKRSFLKSILKEIKRSERPDVIILNYHGGTEYNIIPEPQRRRLFHSIIDLGVDVIIGHHAHVPQGYEKYSNGHIFYGLGNIHLRIALILLF